MLEIQCVCGLGFDGKEEAVRHVEEIHSGEFADRQCHGWLPDLDIVESEIEKRLRLVFV